MLNSISFIYMIYPDIYVCYICIQHIPCLTYSIYSILFSIGSTWNYSRDASRSMYDRRGLEQAEPERAAGR